MSFIKKCLVGMGFVWAICAGLAALVFWFWSMVEVIEALPIPWGVGVAIIIFSIPIGLLYALSPDDEDTK
jgi:hypothetical protein